MESRRASDSRELKQPRRRRRVRCRRRVRRQVKNEFIFYQRNLQLSRSVRYANDSKNVLELNVQWRRVIPMEIRNIIRRRPPSVQDAESGHFTLLFCRGRQRNVQRFITHVHSHCSAH